MKLRKYRWSRDYESAEEELIQMLRHKQVTAERWTAEGGEVFAPHIHLLDKQLWCAEGSITMTADGKYFSLQPGDTLDLPANTVHEAVTGMSGCAMYESPPPASNPAIAAAPPANSPPITPIIT